MRWRGRQQSTNVDDRRGRSVGGKKVAGGLGCGTLIILLIVVLLGGDPTALLQQMEVQNQQAPTTQTQSRTASNGDDLGEMVGVVLKDTENVWDRLFREQIGGTYRQPTLVLFEDQVRSACGFASAATGPFYCPADEKLYIDLSFYNQLKNRFRAPGDFAMAYVVAHEVAHHVQNLLGITDQVHRARGRLSKADYNQLSVRLELQADFLAGVWAHHAQKQYQILEDGDIEEALNAASAIGDDNIQKQSQGYVVPESFTHGTSAQRVRWFRKGLKTGDVNQGDTFNTEYL